MKMEKREWEDRNERGDKTSIPPSPMDGNFQIYFRISTKIHCRIRYNPKTHVDLDRIPRAEFMPRDFAPRFEQRCYNNGYNLPGESKTCSLDIG